MLPFLISDNYLHARELEKIGECESSIETSDYEAENQQKRARYKAARTPTLTDSDRESTGESEVDISDKFSLGESDNNLSENDIVGKNERNLISI